MPAVVAVRWLLSRRIRLKVTTEVHHGFTTLPFGDGPVTAVIARNDGDRVAVLTELGIAKCRKRRFRRPQIVNARGMTWLEGGERLERDDYRRVVLELDAFQPEYRHLRTWGYARVSGSTKTFFPDNPIVVRDMRAGSPTAGELIHP